MFVTSIAGAQGLRLGDVFTTPTAVNEAGSLAKMDPSGVARQLEQAQSDLVAGNNDQVLQTTELLTAWLDRESPEYAHALYLRARAYDAKGEGAKAVAIATDYLTHFQNGADRGWFLVRLAKQKAGADAVSDAAVIWRRILKEGATVSPDAALDGARALLRAGDGPSARTLLQRTEDAGMDDLLRRERKSALLESLLIADDRNLPVPDPQEGRTTEAATFNLQRAMLLELRGERGEAAVEYDKLVQNLNLLTNAERQLLATRVNRRPAWPPPVAAK